MSYPSESVAEKQYGCVPTSSEVGCQNISMPQSWYDRPGLEIIWRVPRYMPILDLVVISLMLKTNTLMFLVHI